MMHSSHKDIELCWIDRTESNLEKNTKKFTSSGTVRRDKIELVRFGSVRKFKKFDSFTISEFIWWLYGTFFCRWIYLHFFTVSRTNNFKKFRFLSKSVIYMWMNDFLILKKNYYIILFSQTLLILFLIFRITRLLFII